VAVLVFGLPLTVTQFAFLRHATVRTTFRQTIRSMARVTEIGGYVHEGHSARVAELALRVGRQLGLGDDDLLDLEYAALLHDIGQLSLTEPIPGGSTLAVPAADRRRVAELGADIVRSTGRLERVAEIVSAQSEPYRGVGETSDPAVPLASRIVKVASAYDDLVHGTAGERYSPLEALERLSLGLAYDYDPVVVAALGRSVTRPRVPA
jgi:response regulator RpfG family c-di-GMP phosphodiesterase